MGGPIHYCYISSGTLSIVLGNSYENTLCSSGATWTILYIRNAGSGTTSGMSGAPFGGAGADLLGLPKGGLGGVDVARSPAIVVVVGRDMIRGVYVDEVFIASST